MPSFCQLVNALIQVTLPAITSPVTTVSPLQVEEGVQHGIIGSKRFHVFFKRGLPLQDKVVYFSETIECTSRNMTVRQLYLYMLYMSSKAERMPANQHPSTPDEVKIVQSNDRIGSFVPSILTRRVALSMTGQLPLKRPLKAQLMNTVGLALTAMAVLYSLPSVTSCCKWLWCW